MKIFRLILFFLINVCLTNAQTLTVTTDKNPVIVGEQFILKFIVDAKAKDFKAPNFQGLRILGGPNSSSSSSYSFVNGESKSEITTTFSYYMSAPKEGSFTISPASVNANKKTILSKPLTINVVKGNQQKDNSLQKNLYIDVKTNKKNIYVGEQIIVTYKLHTRLELENTELTQLPNLNGFWKKDLESSSRFKREVINGIPYNTAIIKKTVLTPQKSGKLNIDPIKVTCSIRVNNQRNRRDPFSNFFNSYNVREEMISSKPIYVNVKELPQPKPDNFLGAVGNFEVSSKVDKNQLNANDALSYSIKLVGTGNIELIEPFNIDFPSDFEVYDPKITEKVFEGGNKRSIKTFEYLLIPRNKGNYKIPKLDFSYFDIKQKKYISKKTSIHNINVLKSINSEEANSSSLNQQKIETINKDINYIKSKTFLLNKDRKKINMKTLYLLYFLPIFLILIYKLTKIISGKNPLSASERKQKQAKKVASKRLKLALEFMNNKDYDGFFEEIEKSLWGYFANKFKVDIINLTKERIEEYFDKSQINTEIKDQFIGLIDTCEFARYSPSSNKVELTKNILEKAEKIIINVESKIK